MLDFFNKWKKYFVFAGLLSCFINILQLTFAFYMFAIYRSIVASYHEKSLYTITVIALYALVSLVFFNYLRVRLLNAAGTDLHRSVGRKMYQNLIRGMSLPGNKGYHQGLHDLEAVRGYFNNQSIYAIFDAPWAPLYLLLIYFFHPVLGMVATLGALVIILLSVLQNILTRTRLSEANADHSRNRMLVATMLRNAEAVNAMGMQGDICRRWNRANESVVRNQTVASKYAGLVQSVTRPMQMFTQVLIYGLGAYYVMTGGLDAGLMVAAAIIMGQAVGPVMRAMASWRFTIQVRDAYQRLRAFLEMVEKLPEKMPLPRPSGRITADNLFLIVDRHTLLHNISFELAPGELMGVIGPSGAGKSTLCRLILGLWPPAGGRIRLDGVDLFYWNKDELGRHMGFLAQEVALFPGTVAENIARMNRSDPEALGRVAEKLEIKEWIESLPQGFETGLNTPGGISLSGGQRQRLALARALYNEPCLLVLDEPDAGLDIQGRASLMKVLRKLQEERTATCVIVTHDPEILKVVDKILVLKEGRQVGFGPKEEILKRMTAPKPGLQAV